jgi:hypothetical protein
VESLNINKREKPVLLVILFSATVSLFTRRTVEGTITDAKSGEILIGVTVQIKGTTSGTTTDINGKYHKNLR